MNLVEELRGSRSGREASHCALSSPAGSLSYRDMFGRVDSLGARLIVGGLAPGERVVLLAPNSLDYVVALLAIVAARGVAVPVAVDAPAQRLARVVDLTAPRISLVHASWKPPAASVRLPGEMRFALSDDLSSVACDRVSGTGCFTEASEATEAAGSDAAMILLSSGSTGGVKGVVLRHAGLAWTARALRQAFGLGPDHVELIVCPLAHSGAWQRVSSTLLAGGTVVIPAGQVSLTALLDDCSSRGVRGFYTPPPLVRYLLRADAARVRAALSALSSIEIGSASVSAAEVAGLLDLLPSARVYVHYGLTECSRALVLDAAAQRDRLGTVGRPLPGVEVGIRDPDDPAAAAARPGEPGEIWLRGPQASGSYWREPELSALTFVDGWVRTGDHGRLGDDGFLTFLGRRDDRITSAGFSFYPGEVEAELGEMPGVRDYLIAGVPDPRGILGEVVWAFVVADDPQAWSAVEWSAVARRRLPAHMLPRRVLSVDSLPRTPSGKTDRRRTVELYADDAGGE